MLILTQTQNLTQTLMIIEKTKKSKGANEHSLFALLFSLWALPNIILATSIIIAMNVSRVAGQQFEIKPPHITVFNQLHYLGWVKSQAISPKICKVILIHQVLGHPIVFFPFALARKACLKVFPKAFCLYGQTI